MTDRVVTFQFCDDIRQEIGNKFSLIGCYAGGVIQVSPIPSVLPKLCAVVTVRTPVERPFRSLVTRIMNEGKSIAEIAFDPQSISIPSIPMPEGATWHALTAVFVLTPFAVEAPCTLTVEAETEEETLLGGNVWIRAVPSGTAPEHAHK